MTSAIKPKLRAILKPFVPAIRATVFAVLLFASAGRWNIPQFWAYFAVQALRGLGYGLACDASIIAERLRPTKDSTDRRRVIILRLVAGAHLIAAGLDVGRFQWTPTVPFGLHVVGFLGLASFGGLFIWSMATNRFFSSAVRIQKERGHHVVTGGPYRYVRHPGYTAAIASMACSPFALGSLVSAVPAALFIALILRRTIVEDAYLRSELVGYTAYADRTRYRLFPCVW